MSGEYEIAGAIGLYDRENEQEKLKIPGPIKENLAVYVRFNFLKKYRYKKFIYSYRLFSKASTRTLEYTTNTHYRPILSAIQFIIGK